MLLVSAGCLWLITEWANPQIESSVGFTVGLAFGWLYPAVVAHALLVFGKARRRRFETALAVATYSIFGVALGLLPAMAFDSAAVGCSFCPADLIALVPSATLSKASTTLGTVAGAGALVGVAVVVLATLTRQSPAGRALQGPVLIPGALFAAVLAVELGRAAGLSIVPTSITDHMLRLIQAALLVTLVGGVAVEWVRARRSRTSVARVVADLGHSPPLGGLRDALASTLNDPDLRLVYPIPGGRVLDASGRPVRLDPETDGRRQITPIVRDGVTVALLEHRSDVLEAADTVDDVIQTARLGLEHERLRAEARAQLADLTAARKRIVAAAGAERQRLERDLHDGAQQRLITMSIRLRLLADDASRLPGRSAALIAEAGREIALAIDDLREVAHGIYPSVLADEGLAAAIESLVERSTSVIGVGDLDVDPVDLSIAEAAYAVVSDVVAAGPGPVSVHATRRAGTLVLVVEAPTVPDGVLVDLRDRVGAVDGTLTAREGAAGRLELIAEIPCAS
jgi:signal transduction histidine kinase